jgi:outer membrane lipoprotein carrier protein
VITLLSRHCRVLLVLLASLAVTPLSAQPEVVSPPAIASAGDFALQQLVTVLQATASLSAEVDQLLLDQEGREVQETRALLSMQRPSSFRWEVTQPYSELMVTDGDTIWRYEPDLEQVTIQNFDEELDRTPVMLLNGTASTIAAAYEVSAASLAEGRQTLFTLLPKQASALFERISLSFEGPTLLEMHFEDSLGQRTTLLFSKVQRNPVLEPGQFRFEPPAGIDVVDGRLD